MASYFRSLKHSLEHGISIFPHIICVCVFLICSSYLAFLSALVEQLDIVIWI